MPVATVFTTHATLLGRYIASSEERFLRAPAVDRRERGGGALRRPHPAPDRAGLRAGVHVFTTVSPDHRRGVPSLLGRTPDLILPNGLNIERFDVEHRLPDAATREHKERDPPLRRWRTSSPATPSIWTRRSTSSPAGRFEPRNKGFDLCLETMARLNARAAGRRSSDVTVVFFVAHAAQPQSLDAGHSTPAACSTSSARSRQRIAEGVGERLFRRGAAGERVRLDDLVDEYWLLRFRRTQYALRTDQPAAGGDPRPRGRAKAIRC